MFESYLHDAEPEVEVLARRALGVALNTFWSESGLTPGDERIDATDPDRARSAMNVLLSRVPPGPERDLAVDLLRHSSNPQIAS
jgi:hypothetical protein